VKKILFVLTIITIFIVPLNAKNLPKQAVNICAVAIPAMNMYVINYEYLYNERHGMAARLEYNPMSASGIDDARGVAVVLDYRWHLSPKLESFFVGPYARYRYVDGSGSVEGIKFDFTVPEVNIGLNAGYRWIHDATGINVVFAFGYGYSWVTEKINPTNTKIVSTFNEFKKDNDTFLDAPFYGEFSIGYAF
jgi:hypothetical protein